MTYNNAPIKEAIFDVRVDKLANSSLEDLERIHEYFLKEYPNKKKQINFTGKIEFRGEEQITNADSQVKGFLFCSENMKIQVQVRLDGFTLNMLNPYSNWKEFSDEAMRLWEIYVRELEPINVTRIALRYINKIDIPLPFNNFQEYFVNIPPIPGCLPQSFSNFFMRVEVPVENNTIVAITETLERPAGNKLPFILDIDVFKNGSISKEKIELEKEFEILRNLKNKTFENSITNNTRDLFN